MRTLRSTAISSGRCERLRRGLKATRDFVLRICCAATIFAISSPATALASVSPTQPSGDPVQGVGQEELLWWLPADTESVVAARGPFSLQVPRHDDDQDWGQRKASQADIFLEFEQRPLELLFSNSLDLQERLKGSSVQFAMQGSRHFRKPSGGSEVMTFEGCSIVVFDNSFAERGNGLMQTLATIATSTRIVSETRVLVFHDKFGDAEWDSFLAFPRPDVLLSANNLRYLQEVLERMRQRKSPRALPQQLPEWRYLELGTRFWGLRHYDRTQAKQDPTSPFSDERTFGAGDQKAIGIVFAVNDSNQKKEAVMTYLSGDESMVRKAMRKGTSSEEALLASFSGHEVITGDGGKSYVDAKPEVRVEYQVRLRTPAPGVLQRTYSLERTGTISHFILNMEIGLGRGMWF